MKVFKCYSAKMAQYFCRLGFQILRTEVNYKKPQYDVYIFEDTPSIRLAFDNYCRKL